MDSRCNQESEQVKKRLTSNEDGNTPKLMYHYLLNVLCFQFRILSIPYFLDECSMWELDDYIYLIPYTDRNLWECSRLGAYIDAKSHFRGISKYSDICEFKWEKNDEPIEDVVRRDITNDEIARLKELSKRWEGKD